ncbi:daxx-like protein isoform X2 [Nomia melanderi]|nr:bromodomain-containing protein DDB_G0280777-like isoform X2 [Nomia melanderi]XP_031828960.1 bromodomain-containing protein DDB_G0280777-like isoform X2 [Nomia melanderi]XP_031828961.1 bromodomain-containing protein DDB_G0280777-like isoform X2 [Nomia melanderi]XP_031828962.1 bromodomain-containing protein DDB_G0280777-like isoform X2 [Nomia melanderi]
MESGEVICISSDDEDTGQDKTNERQMPIKLLENNRVKRVKPEIILHECGEIVTCEKKRKASEVDNDDNSSRSNKKVLREERIKKHSVEEDTSGLTSVQKQKDETILKPKLVVKESKPFSPIEQDIFPMFISLCLQKDRSEDMKVITNKLKRCYEQLDSNYANSEAFISFINEKRNYIMNSKNKLYSHIADVMNEMKKGCRGKSTLLLNNKKCTSSSNKLQCNNSDVPSSSAHTNNVDNVNVDENNVTNEEDKAKDRTINKKIKLLEAAMDKCQKYIRKWEESEVNFDDDDNSSYIKVEKYKHRMLKLYNKYCQYTGGDIDAGRQYLRPKHLSTTGIVTLDHAITNFINSKLSKLHKVKKNGTFTDAVIFPDYKDILDCVERCNKLSNLRLDTKQQQRMAKKAFIKLGEYLQRSRRADYWDTFSLFLEDKEDDPALKDQELALKLLENKREGEKRLTNVFEEYVKKQESSKNCLVATETSSDEEDEEESVENEDEDNENGNISEEEYSLSISRDKSSSETEEKEEEKEEDVNIGTDEVTVKETSINNKVETNNSNENEITVKETRINNKVETNNSNENELTVKETRINNKVETNNSNSNEVIVKETSINNKVDTNNLDIIEIGEGFHTNASDMLKDCADDCNLKTTNSSNVVNIPDCKNESESRIEENDGTVVSKVGVDVPSMKVDVPIDRIKEDEANIMTEDATDTKSLEEEKPLLRVRSFARHPMTWKDGTDKVESDVEKNVPTTSINNSIVDLTVETPNENDIVIDSCTNVTTDSEMFVHVKSKNKLKRVFVAAGKDIVKLKNISKCTGMLNPRVVGPNVTMESQNDQVVPSQKNVVTIYKQPAIVSVVRDHSKQSPNSVLKPQVRHISRYINIQPKKS